jgi:hypothetical protein
MEDQNTAKASPPTRAKPNTKDDKKPERPKRKYVKKCDKLNGIVVKSGSFLVRFD